MSALRLAAACATILAAFVLLGCGGGGESSYATQAPKELVEEASLAGLRSGEPSVTLKIDSPEKREEATFKVFGTFLPGEGGGFPQLDFSVESSGELGGRALGFDLYLLATPEDGRLYYKGHNYLVDPASLHGFESVLEQAQGEEGAGNVRSCQEAAAGIDFSRFVKHLSGEGREADIAGNMVRWVGGDLDVPAAIDALAGLSEDPGCGPQLEALAPGLAAHLVAARDELAGATGEARVRLGIDRRHILRDLSLNWVIKPKDPKGEEIVVELTMFLTTPHLSEIPLSTDGAQPFGALLKKLGVDPRSARGASGDELVIGALRAIGQGLTEARP
jgi:hypothetical protein